MKVLLNRLLSEPVLVLSIVSVTAVYLATNEVIPAVVGGLIALIARQFVEPIYEV